MISVNRLFLLSVVSFFFTYSNAQQWIDITDTYIINPRFDGDDRSTGWSGTGYGAYNPVENAEFYQMEFNTYQDITGLTPGKYRVSLDAFYRMGNASDDYSRYTSGDYSEYQYAKLYAISSLGNYEIGIAPSSSAAIDDPLGGNCSALGSDGWWGGGPPYIPNNMEAAFYWFNAGYYDNTLECEVGDDGVLRIGVRKETTVGGDWTCLDNWQLEYYGTVKAVTKIDILDAPSEVSVGQTFELETKVSPSDATYQKVEWTSSSSSVISVEKGVFTAKGIGTATLTAKSIDGNAVASVVVKVKDTSAPTSASLVINEIMAANVDVYRDPSTNYGSWVELYNPTSQGVKLGGIYVSDDANNLRKHKLVDDYGVLAGKGFAILNFDHHEVWTELSYRQIDFKLNVEGGEIIVSDGSSIIARMTYPAAIGRTSYARTSDGGNEWKTCGTPTPGSTNKDSSFATEQLAAPTVNRDGQFFTGSLSVNVGIPSGATLRYTTDGTTPTLEKGKTSSDGQFNISSTTCFRFRLFKEGYLPSPVVARSYISGSTPSIPTISVVMDKDDWDGKQNGLFSYSSLGRPGNGQSSKYNANMDWDRPVNFEFITADNEYALSQECDMSTCGGWSRGWTPHSFKLKATKVYDLRNTFDYQFFDEKPYLKHKTLQIRNGGNDSGCRIKDPAIQGIVASSGLKVEHQAWQPVVVYINGSKYDVLNMREPNNKHYGYSNSGIDTDEMDQFEMSPDSGYVQMEGTEESFLKLCELSNNASNASTYEEIGKLLDIDEYINYMAVELYTGNWDWPQNNVKGYRDRNDGKFRFVLFDMDGVLSTSTPFGTFFGKQYYTFDTLHGYDYSQGVSVEGNRNYEEIKFVTLFKNLLQNETFKKQFVDTYCLVAGSVFEPSRVKEVVDEMASVLDSNIDKYSWSTANSIKNSYNQGYQSSLVSHMQSYLGLSSSAKQQVSLSSSVKNAKLLVDGLDVPTGVFEGALYGPITYKAVAPAGYEFVGWEGDGTTSGTDYKLFDYNSDWAYADYDITSKSWKTAINAFDSKGSAPLGYGKSESTSLTKNRLSYYFGREVTLEEEPSSYDKFTLNFTVDDGAVVYVNGVEAGRYNMPGGTPNDNTAASTYAPNNPDTGTMSLKASLFKKGTNYIAVEVHNNQASSSDIYWDAELIQTVPDEIGGGYLSTDAEMTIEGGGTYNLVACFEPVDDNDLIAAGTTPVKVNEVSAGNSMYVNEHFKKDDWIELYNTTDESVDIAGMYLSDNENKPQKYQVPTGSINTVIEPHGHIVIWASKRDAVSQLHASFKLDNADDAKVLLTNQDGTWNDVLTYSAHAGVESVGLYPDGSNDVYLMTSPTINMENTINPSSPYLSTYVPVLPEPEEPEEPGKDDPETEPEPDQTFVLAMNEGWNWISHPLSEHQSLSPFVPNATDFLGYAERYCLGEDGSWTGSLASFAPATSYKVRMAADSSCEYTGKYFNTSFMVDLKTGWNWIGYPLTQDQSVSATFSGLAASEGDAIVGQEGFAVYENGKWTGSLEVLSPGEGYLYKSMSNKQFAYNESSHTNARARAPFRVQPLPAWTADMTLYPDMMNIVADVIYEGEASEEFSVAAFDEQEVCRGVGKYIDGKLYLSINGEPGMKISFSAFDGSTEFLVNETYDFVEDVKGLRKSPEQLTIGVPVGVIAAENSSSIESESYYTVDGILVANSRKALRPGIYVAKYQFTNGNTLAKKIMVK